MFLGNYAGVNNTTASNNVFLGYSTGAKNTTGANNVLLGNNAGYTNTISSNNVFIGNQAGYTTKGTTTVSFTNPRTNTSTSIYNGSNNVFLGNEAGYSNTTGANNVFLGNYAGVNNTTASNNVFLGYSTGAKNTEGANNVLLGNRAGYTNTTGSSNVYLGNAAGYNNGGKANVFIGDEVAYNSVSGDTNVVIGARSAQNANKMTRSVVIGMQAGGGYDNQSINTEYSDNVFIGTKAGHYIRTGSENVFLGNKAGYLVTTGTGNIYLGTEAGGMNYSGKYNIYLGYKAGSQQAGVGAEGENNVFIGKYAGHNVTGNNKLIIGIGAEDAHWGKDPLIYGEFDNKIVKIYGDLIMAGNLCPSGTSTSITNGRNLGASDNIWRNLYVRTINATGVIYANDDVIMKGDLSVTGDISCSNLDMEDLSCDNLSLPDYGRVKSALIPSSTYNLGSSDLRWNYLYAQYINTSSSATIGGTLNAKSTVNVTGNLNVSGNVGDLIPQSLADLGDENSRWRYLYVNRIDATGPFSLTTSSTSQTVQNAVNIETYYTGTNNVARGLRVKSSGGANVTSNYGIAGRAECYSAGCKNVGVYGYAKQIDGTTSAVGVYGTVDKSSSDIGVAYGVYSSGKAGGTSGWSGSSDARLKKDVHTLTGALDKVLKLRGVSFYWKNREEMAALKGVPADSVDYGYDNVKHIGVIAQELEAEYPELVSTDCNGFKAVEYSAITPILIEAMKELKAEKDELKAEKDALEAKVDRLEKLVEELLKKQ